MVHREIAHQPRVGIVLIRCQDLPDGRQVEHVSLRGGPHPLKHNRGHVTLRYALTYPGLKARQEVLTLCVWYTMMALSDSVSTTWKFSMVAGRREREKAEISAEKKPTERRRGTAVTHSPSLIAPLCPRSSGRPRGPSLPSQRAWL